MLPIDLETGGKHYAFLGRAGEDVATRLWASIEPIGVVERASTQAQDIRKSLEIEAEGRAAPAAEVQRYALPATIRLVLVGPRSRSGEDDIFLLKDWLDQVRRSCKSGTRVRLFIVLSSLTYRNGHLSLDAERRQTHRPRAIVIGQLRQAVPLVSLPSLTQSSVHLHRAHACHLS